jgi:hypothetical protein
MNSQDSFTIKFLLAQYNQGTMKISGRIIGVKVITPISTTATLGRLWRLSGIGTLVGLFGTLFTSNLPVLPYLFTVIMIISLGITYVIEFSGKLKKTPTKK